MDYLAVFIAGLTAGSGGMYYLAYREMLKIRKQNEIILKRTAPGK